MLFNSLEFLIFLPIVLILYFLTPNRFRWILLLIASYYFYMAWKPEYIILIVFSTLVDYFASILMYKQKTKKMKKLFLFISLLANLGLLFVFKYFNFFNQQFGILYTSMTKVAYPIENTKLLLPIGISFYTFQTLSYTIDVYREKRKPEYHLGYFALYVTYFPQLVAGPIERSDRLLPQLKSKQTFSFDRFTNGILKISWGFFKKVVIADRIAMIANTIFGDVHTYDGVFLIVGVCAFAIQIYCDFSAYSDIAIGCAQIMGVSLMENFKTPYFAKSISDFWSRWHISLSTWFRDYLYIPLGGNRVDKRWKYYRNLMIVFVVSGIWHGANWTFVAWGALHGTYQIIERMIEKKVNNRIRIPNIFAQIFTLCLVLIGWVFFRAESIQDAFYIFKHISVLNIQQLFSEKIVQIGLDKYDIGVLVASISALFFVELFQYRGSRQQISNGLIKGLISVGIALFILVFGYYGYFNEMEFIYFQF